MALQQVMKTTVIRLATSLHWCVEAILMEGGFMKTILEVVAELGQLIRVQSASLHISANFETLLTDLCEGCADLLTLIKHRILVGVEPRVSLLRVGQLRNPSHRPVRRVSKLAL